MIKLNNSLIKSVEYKVKRKIDDTLWAKLCVGRTDVTAQNYIGIWSVVWRQFGTTVWQQLLDNTYDKIKPN